MAAANDLPALLLDLLRHNPLPLGLIVAHIARVQPAAAGQVASELRALAAAGQVAEIDGEWVRQYPVAQVIEPDAVPAGLLF